MTDPTKWWDTRLTDKKQLDNFIEHLGPPERPSRETARSWVRGAGFQQVLDVGCGPALDQWEGFDWTGVDPSEVLRTQAAARGAEVLAASAEDLIPCEDESYEVVYSRHVWEHLPDFRRALREACRVAKYAVVVVFFRPPGETAQQNVSDGAYYNDYALNDIEREFTREWPGCNFEIIRIPRTQYLPSGELVLAVTR